MPNTLIVHADGWAIVKRPLGRGVHGTVYAVRRFETNECGALKTFDTQRDANRELDICEQIMAEKQHPFLVGMKDLIRGAISNDLSPWASIFMDFYPGGDMLDHVTHHGSLTEHDALDFMSKLACGTAFLHAILLCHLDIKLENVFLDNHGAPRLGDFGMSRRIIETIAGGGKIGTPIYMAPEVITSTRFFGTPVDVYALGVCAYAMTTGLMPCEEGMAESLNAKVHKTLLYRAIQRNFHSPSYLIILDACLQLEPTLRPTAQMLQEMCTDLRCTMESCHDVTTANIHVVEQDQKPSVHTM